VLRTLLIMTMGVSVLALCSPVAAQDVQPTVIARVGETEITAVDIAIAAQLALAQIQEMDEASRADFLMQSVIDMNLMANAARDAGLEEDPLVRARIDFEVAQVLQQEYARKVANESVTPEAMQAAYEDYVASLAAEEERRFSHFMTQSREQAEAAIAEIEAGALLADVANSIPAEGTVNQNTDIGFIREQDLAPKLAEAGYALTEVGQLTEPLATEFGWQILQLTELRTAEPESFETMTDQLQQYVRENAVAEALRDDLPARYPVTVLSPPPIGLQTTETIE
jgi:peptidyl-prolyl cis-trans isomerase C